MALLTCPDCSGPVSDNAAACPKCGRPMRSKRMKTVPGGGDVDFKSPGMYILALVIVGLCVLIWWALRQ